VILEMTFFMAVLMTLDPRSFPDFWG